MKDCPFNRGYTCGLLSRYSQQLGLRKPFIAFTLDDLPKDLRTKSVQKLYKMKAAISFIPDEDHIPWMLFDIGCHSSKKEIEDTIAHELLHFRFPHLNHGEEFYKRLGMVLMGKKYGKVKKK